MAACWYMLATLGVGQGIPPYLQAPGDKVLSVWSEGPVVCPGSSGQRPLRRRGKGQAAAELGEGSCAGTECLSQGLGFLHLTQPALAPIHHGVATGAGWFTRACAGIATGL